MFVHILTKIFLKIYRILPIGHESVKYFGSKNESSGALSGLTFKMNIKKFTASFSKYTISDYF